MSAHHSPATLRIQRRLDRLLLEDLKHLAAEQGERIDELERRLAQTEDAADFWARSHHDLADHLANDTEDARAIGLTRTGELLVVRTGAAA